MLDKAPALSAVLQNLIPIIVVTVLVFAIWHAGREPLWAEAYRRLRRSPVAMTALAIIGIYGLIGFLDSIGWQNTATSPRQSVVDRLFDRPQEKTYSAPFAKITYGEPTPHKLMARHILGTDAIGSDVLFLTLKGCRTALIIGGFTSLLVTPFALLFGMMAGYFGKRVDDVIQYTYTVFSSIPGTLLIIAMLLVLGHGLFNLCLALGITSWVGLCRLTRGETLKHRDRDYVRAARALGVSHSRILVRHILPNLLPVVLISVTLSLSGLVLSETILTYLGVGVEAGVGSWGNMIDAARLELAREPIIWWNLASASGALFLLVLAFNIFGDALRDAIDPRLRSS